MVDVADAAGPVDRLHHLLLAASGRVDDQGIDTARELLGSGLPGAAADFLIGCLLAGHTPVTPREQQQLRRVLEQVGTRPDPVDRVELAAELPPDEHRFDAAPEIGAQVTDALAPVAARLHGVRGLRLAARTTPAGASYGAVPRHVLLAEVGPDGSAAAVAHQLVLALREADVECSVDVYSTGAQLPEYHRHALAAAEELVPATALPAAALAARAEQVPQHPAAREEFRHEVPGAREVPAAERTAAEPAHEEVLGAVRSAEVREPEHRPAEHGLAPAAGAADDGQFGADRSEPAPQVEPSRAEPEPVELPEERIGSAADLPHVPDPEQIRAASAQESAAHRSAAQQESWYEAEPAPELGYQHAPSHEPEPAHEPEPSYQPEPAYGRDAGYERDTGYQSEPAYEPEPSYQPEPAYEHETAYEPEPSYQPEAVESQEAASQVTGQQAATAQDRAPEGGVDADGMRVPAAVDAKLTDRERNLLRKLHEELAQREQTRSGPREQTAQRPAEGWPSPMPGGTGGFPPIGAPANGSARPDQQRS